MTLSRKVADPVWGQRRPDATQILYYYYLGGRTKEQQIYKKLFNLDALQNRTISRF
jgi:hypothetical protein